MARVSKKLQDRLLKRAYPRCPCGKHFLHGRHYGPIMVYRTLLKIDNPLGFTTIEVQASTRRKALRKIKNTLFNGYQHLNEIQTKLQL